MRRVGAAARVTRGKDSCRARGARERERESEGGRDRVGQVVIPSDVWAGLRHPQAPVGAPWEGGVAQKGSGTDPLPKSL